MHKTKVDSMLHGGSSPSLCGARTGLSLLELMVVVTILGMLATLSIVRMATPVASANTNACHTLRGDIELQAQLWRRNNGSYPAANLSNIGADAAYFPEGLPTCPVDGSAYTINTATGRVIGHTH